MRITELVEAHPAYSAPEPDQPHLWEVTLRSQIVAPDGTRSDAGGIVAEGLDPGTDLRTVATGADLDARLATLPSGFYQPAHDVDGDGVPDPVGAALTDVRLTEAEAMAAADPADDFVIEVVARRCAAPCPPRRPARER